MNAYLDMMDAGVVPEIPCGTDRDHPRPYVKFDETGDNWWLECLACAWKLRPGLGLIETVRGKNDDR